MGALNSFNVKHLMLASLLMILVWSLCRNCEDIAMSFLVANTTNSAPIWVKGECPVYLLFFIFDYLATHNVSVAPSQRNRVTIMCIV